jgi:hypothetical protein
MKLMFKRMSRWLSTALVGAGMTAMVGSTALATTLLGNDFQLSFDPGVETSPDVRLSTMTTNGIFLSAWNETSSTLVGNNVFGQIESQSGNLIGPEISISNASGGTEDARPRIAYSPVRNAFMVVWCDGRNSATTGNDIYGQLISATGTLIGSVIPIGVASNNQERPGIAYNSTNDQFLVVWNDLRNSSTGSDIYGQLLNSSGTLIGPNFVISSAKNVQDMSRVAYDPIKQQFLMVWSDGRTTADGYDIYGQKLGPSGTLIGAPIVVSNAPYDQFRPDVTWDSNDNEFMVVFVDCRNVGAPACVSGEKTNGDIYGQVVLSGGALSGGNFPVAISTDSEYRPAISFSPTSGLFQVIYSDEPNTINTGASQIWGVEVMPNGTLVGPNMAMTPTTSTGIQERASITWNQNNNQFLVDFVNQSSSGTSENVWGQFLNP